ncbi:MAG TPA: hypothetical protein VFA23_17475 [Dongiaceae bacterium]|nr:hypothetical protein [Dongiaceae bacterium]
MRRFPAEFEGFLSARGQRLLAGRSPLAGALADPRRRFLAADGLLDPGKVEAGRRLLESQLLPHLARIDRPIPPEATWEMEENYAELLPKAMRASTAAFERRRGRAFEAAERIGLVAMLGSQSFRLFAERLAGRALSSRWGMQALCYGPGDYVGPHNDHHPEEPEARRGYLDLHLTLSSPDVAQQWLVYAVAGHFTRIEPAARTGRVSAYRLPLWHYTTPLVARRGREGGARRWVLLGTFLYKDPTVPPAARTAAR